jgi:hypothetical protein
LVRLFVFGIWRLKDSSIADLRKTTDFAILDGLGVVWATLPSLPPLAVAGWPLNNPETILKSLLKGTEILC